MTRKLFLLAALTPACAFAQLGGVGSVGTGVTAPMTSVGAGAVGSVGAPGTTIPRSVTSTTAGAAGTTTSSSLPGHTNALAGVDTGISPAGAAATTGTGTSVRSRRHGTVGANTGTAASATTSDANLSGSATVGTTPPQ